MPNHDEWPAFVLPWDDTSSGPTDMSYLLPKPAGAHGFVRIESGHPVTGDGQRWRIWGQNITRQGPLPPMDMAPTIARRMAKYGINCLRLHHMDHRWPSGVLMRRLGPDPADGGERDDESTRALDPEAMARLDYFIACCRDEGIYIDLNLNVSRMFTAADGVKQSEWIGYAKSLTYFDPQIIALQKEYAAQMLDHVNPFTGHRYADDPTIAIVELINENSILESWLKGRLLGEQTEPFGTWGDIPSSYAEDLDRLWNDWLCGRYADRVSMCCAWDNDLRDNEDAARRSVRRLRPEDMAAASPGRFADEATFYAEMERHYFRDMAAYLRGELGVHQVILGTSDHNHGIHGALHVENNSLLGIVDGHVYWQHPRYGSGGYSTSDWSISNTPMVDAPDHSAISQLSRSRVIGMPYTVSETNEPFPNDYACEFLPILTAYGLLQDWDGLFLYSYAGGREYDWDDERIPPFFLIANDPLKMTQSALCAAAFLRGDVMAAKEMVPQRLTHERVIESLRRDQPDDEHPYAIQHLLGRLALMHQTGIADFHADALSPAEGEIKWPDSFIWSDTEELVWYRSSFGGQVIIDAPRFQAFIGRKGETSCANTRFSTSVPFSALMVLSTSEAPISKADELLVSVAARVANTGMKWTDSTRQSLGDDWGGAPTRAEMVTGKLSLSDLTDAAAVWLYPLDERGQPTKGKRPFTLWGNEWTVALEESDASLWYLVRVEHD